MGDHKELIEQFKSITNANEQESTFYLESHNWDIEEEDDDIDLIIDLLLFQHGGSAQPTTAQPTAARPTASSRPNTRDLLSQMDDEEEDDRPYRRPPQQSTSSSSSSSSSSSKPKPKSSSQPSRGGIRTLSDISKDDGSDHDDDDDDDDKTQRYFTGGEKSGLMKDKDDVVDDVFDSAKKQGAKPADQPEKEAKEYFDGTGYQLGSGGGEAQQTSKSAPKPKEEVEEIKITFWANGFTLNDGPLRRLDDPANREFLEHIQRGKVPPELETNAPAGGLSIHLIDSRAKEYSEPIKPRYVAFSGGGHTLGSTPSAPTSTSTSSTSSTSTTSTTSTTASKPKPTVNIDSSKPTTTVQIVLADGVRQNATFNETHTLQDLISYINQLTGNTRPFDLMSGFPQKPLSIDPSKSLKDADLLNSSVKQKYK
ncbi:UBX domain-containing protein [Cavenderia fasciculata]|uniref:UBX domain-containing protein n=1 Tax=Cavenderia fasciculata TaxID=261658 RepID=F4Q896_CACFS|nr:UBX domain-containing protein [Cavenderia fasciculata]EGG15996.1 UBX domain-containing protein [Cavenderia fasciculata]|eukprot:XP_004352321.1 UBX domain-containing protein [Cavenderia fasciculata]